MISRRSSSAVLSRAEPRAISETRGLLDSETERLACETHTCINIQTRINLHRTFIHTKMRVLPNEKKENEYCSLSRTKSAMKYRKCEFSSHISYLRIRPAGYIVLWDSLLVSLYHAHGSKRNRFFQRLKMLNHLYKRNCREKPN